MEENCEHAFEDVRIARRNTDDDDEARATTAGRIAVSKFLDEGAGMSLKQKDVLALPTEMGRA